MGRPLLALGLLAVAALLLGSLFTELEDSIQDPEPFAPDQKLVEKAAQQAAAHPEYLETAADAGMLELLQNGEITIPPGAAEVDGDMLRLLQDVEWTVPSGTRVHDLTLPLPPGTEITLPSGTRVEGDTLVFPPGSSLTLDDGTVLDLPEGGRLRIPDADPAALKAQIRDGTFTVPAAGGIFTSPVVQNHGDWPITLPEGSTFAIPEGFTLPEGTWKEGGRFELPAGHQIETDGSTEAPVQGEKKQGLFERIGQIDLTPPEPKKEDGSGAQTASGGFGYVKTLLWSLVALAAVALAYLAWRHRKRLAALFPAGGAGVAGLAAPRHPYRLIATFDGRPERLPLALAPGDARTMRIRVEAETGDEHDQGTWRATSADLSIRLGDRLLHDGPAGAEGATVTVPALPTGDHPLQITVKAPGHRPAKLVETLRVAPWAEQVARDYDHLARAIHARTPLPHGFTPRLLEAHAHPLIPAAAQRPLGSALTTFEQANYSQATIQEEDWVRMAHTVARIQDALGRPVPPGGRTRRAGPEAA